MCVRVCVRVCGFVFICLPTYNFKQPPTKLPQTPKPSHKHSNPPTNTQTPAADHRQFWSLGGAGEGADGAVVTHGRPPPHVYRPQEHQVGGGKGGGREGVEKFCGGFIKEVNSMNKFL